MRQLGFVLFVVGVIVSSWYAARFVPDSAIEGSGPQGAITSMDRLGAWGGVAGIPFAGGAVLMVAGGVMARRAMARHAHISASGGTADDTQTMLRAMDAAVAALPTGEPREHAAELRRQLDHLLEEMIPAFLEARQRHVINLGPVGYAELSSAFSSAERALARAWSALTDEAWEEVPPCLENARRAMAQSVRLATQFEPG